MNKYEEYGLRKPTREELEKIDQIKKQYCKGEMSGEECLKEVASFYFEE